LQLTIQTSTKRENKNMTTLQLKTSIDRSPLRLGFLLIAFALFLAWLGLSPTAQAQLSPPPDGGYPGFNTATGFQALSNNVGGVDNTATGGRALFSNTSGIHNTTNGFDALCSNITGRQNTATGAAALQSNTSAISNTANGAFALSSNIIGNNNTASGAFCAF
jgi:hypothetical protein